MNNELAKHVPNPEHYQQEIRNLEELLAKSREHQGSIKSALSNMKANDHVEPDDDDKDNASFYDAS